MGQISITVAIPAYNRENLIQSAIESCLIQSPKIDEIIVVDNHSEDHTFEISKKFEKKYNNIKVIRNSANIGMVRNWNKCLKLANSKYVSILHSDDILPKNWTKNVIKTISEQKNDDIALYFGSAITFESVNNSIIYKTKIRLFNRNIKFLPKESIINLWKNYFGNPNNSSAIIYNHKIFKEVGYFDPKYQTESDQEFHIRVLNKYPSYYINKDLVLYRRHEFQAFDKKKHIESPDDSADRILRSVKLQYNYLENKIVYLSYCGIYLYLAKFIMMGKFNAVKKILSIKDLFNLTTIINFPRFILLFLHRRLLSRYSL